MPELPEVETLRRELQPVLVGRRVVDVWRREGPRWQDAQAAVASRVQDVSRRGKYLILELLDDCDGREHDLIVHLGMTGQLLATTGFDPADPHLHARFTLDDGGLVVFRDVRKFGRMRSTPHGQHDSILALRHMGPEPLSEDFDVERFTAALAMGRSPVKARLLQQRVVSGLGNIYADEALHAASVHPGRHTLTGEEAARLHRAVREVLEVSITGGGTTFRDYRRSNGKRGENVANLRVYGRAGQPCRSCGAPLSRATIAGRTTVFCATCQPAT